jgi:pimeloyl-ACP methyl ester carboxylesterase
VTGSFVRANGLRFAVASSGPADGPLALLLHGFPDTPATWRHLAPRLVEAGYRVATPYLRGYAPTTVPVDRRLDPDVSTADVNALHRALGGDRNAVLIGHDWGAIAAARAAAAAPDRWRRVVTMAVPPERVLASARRSVPQARRSAYGLAFQLPGAERRLVADDLHRVRLLWRRWSPGYRMEEADLVPLRACFGSPGVPSAALSYYRGFAAAAARGRALAPRVGLPPQPHLVLHGREDGCIDAVWAERTVGQLAHSSSRVAIVDEVGHFLHLEAPDRIADLVLPFVTGR